MSDRFLGIDVGAESIKLVELRARSGGHDIVDRQLVDHHKKPAQVLTRLLQKVGWSSLCSAAVTGRASRTISLSRVPTKAALAQGVAHLLPEHVPGTVVSIGSHGFSVLEIRAAGQHVYRENSRCSQGTGNFLRQLVERFELSIDEASELCADVAEPAALSGRCPVILKTDMTHLANKGEPREAIVAGLYDAVCENVQVLVKPGLSPRKVILAGGVMRSKRIRANFRTFCTEHDMELVDADIDDCLYFEAVGAGLSAAAERRALPSLDALYTEDHATQLERVPSLKRSLSRVTRMSVAPFADSEAARCVVLGFDIGSTGSKAVAVDVAERRQVWEGYIDTLGAPVKAAQNLAAKFLDQTAGRHQIAGVGATGSGREIVGSLMSSCFGPDPVFVLNEIAAHAEGALYFDDQVDTIFEIGGQDAKYIRLDGGRIYDAAMNEACSAGTGSFIAEQGSKFSGVCDVADMGNKAMAADEGVSLGQHCSVFMAEIIDGAVAAGVPEPSILAGIYDSIIQNYLNRVKGNRSVGKRIFCQGMPFMSDALAAAVARQTGRSVVIPPNPGTIGALGIALLAVKEVDSAGREAIDLRRFLDASVDRKDTFVCRSKKGCGGAGNKCKIDRIRTTVAGRKQRFFWGGNCSLYDAGTRSRKLPDLAPDAFRERQQLVRELIDGLSANRGRKRVALTDEFTLKGMIPFFATFIHRLGFDVSVYSDGGQLHLKRGIEGANVPFCAPMQLFQGVVATMLDDEPDYVLLPRVRELPRQRSETHAVTCPIVQATPDIVGKSMAAGKTTVLNPRIDMGVGNLGSRRFRDSARRLAASLGADDRWQLAFAAAHRAQLRFDSQCKAIGRKTLAFASEHDLTVVVVLGRSYTIYNKVLNSNVPNLVREQGVLALPVDCYPIAADVPVFEDLYWGYGQQNIRAAQQIRRTDGIYAVFCSNYSCGPDSFNLHFFAYAMENKPFAIIETDGHSGDAGTKTRIEAFLYCVDGDRRLAKQQRDELRRTELQAIERHKVSLQAARAEQRRILVPRLGPGAEVVVACMRAEGIVAETLPMPTRDSLRLGRRYTSGKECVPMTITTGSLLERLERERDSAEQFAFFMPTANGPCRFGVYNLLHKILLEKTGWLDRVTIVSPSDTNYFAECSADFEIRLCVGFVAADLLLAALHDVRPVETRPGAAQELYDRYLAELRRRMASLTPGTLVEALSELGNGAFGVRKMLARAAGEFRAVKDMNRDVPTVSVVGEIYVRLDPFANDFVVEKLEQRGIRAQVAPFYEWIEYMTHLQFQRMAEGRALASDKRMNAMVKHALQSLVIDRFYRELASCLGWGPRTTVKQTLAAAAPYVSSELMGEAVLTVGGPIHEHEHGGIDGVVSVGPHECMPNKVAEAQFAHVSEDHGLISLTLPVNGDPLDAEVLDRFAFEVHQRHAAWQATGKTRYHGPTPASFTRALSRQALAAALRFAPALAPPAVAQRSIIPIRSLLRTRAKPRARRGSR